MRVLLVSNLYPPYVIGGAELIASYLAEGLAQRSHQVTVVTSKGPDTPDLPGEDAANPRIIRFFPPNRYWLFDRRPRSTLDKARWHLQDLWNRASGRRFADILDAVRPDVLHSHNIDGFSPIVWRIAKRRGIPTIHTAHDYHFLCPRSNLLDRHGQICTTPHPLCRGWRKYYGVRLTDVDIFASPSHFLLDQYRAAGLCPRRGVVAANGVPLPTQRAPSAPTDSPGALRLLFIGGLTESKGITVALEAMRQIPADLPVRLDIAGTGPLDHAVEQAAAGDSRIRWHGFVSGAAKEALFDADLLLFPSLWYENMPTTILEASSRGLGVLGSDLGATREFVTEDNGVRFPAGDAHALAKLIQDFQADRSKLTHFRQHAPASTRTFTIPAMVDRYTRLYDELLAK